MKKKKIKLPPDLRVVPAGQKTTAYSYIRFSSKKQEHGTSLVRQLKETRDYCLAAGLELDESWSFRDLGVSGFKGKNLERGFGELIAACEAGLIKPGSALVVEAVDRITRQRPRKASALFSRLLDDFGLEIHLTGINRVIYPDSPTAADEGMDLLLIVMLAIRASEEQETKADRLREAFAIKRVEVGMGQKLMETNRNKMPWWISCEGLGKGETPRLVVEPERADIVRLIYQWTAAGESAPKIARCLHEQGIPTWRPKTKHWTSARVRDLIRSRAPEGFLEETPKTAATGLTFSIPDYYPKLVDEPLAVKARLAMKANCTYGRTHEVKGSNERPINILRGLIRLDGHWCRYQTQSNGKDGVLNGYYTAYDELPGKCLGSVSALLLEPTLLAGLSELTPADLAPEVDQEDPAKLALVRHQAHLATVDKAIVKLSGLIETNDDVLALLDRLREREKEKREIEAKIADLQIRVQSVAAASVGKKEIKELQSLRDADMRDNAVRDRIGGLLKRLVSRIDVSYDLTREIKGHVLRTVVLGKSRFLPDPVPPGKRRKSMSIILRFRRGGSRVILRMSEQMALKTCGPNMLYSGRVDPEPVTVTEEK